mmetsp:Transcript_21328/g.62098  ORF Transcript_21328/g.62098 Transcript_21328/m.62098 type:complete len:200 (+) Transcript_21328:1029-1628(+)
MRAATRDVAPPEAEVVRQRRRGRRRRRRRVQRRRRAHRRRGTAHRVGRTGTDRRRVSAFVRDRARGRVRFRSVRPEKDRAVRRRRRRRERRERRGGRRRRSTHDRSTPRLGRRRTIPLVESRTSSRSLFVAVPALGSRRYGVDTAFRSWRQGVLQPSRRFPRRRRRRRRRCGGGGRSRFSRFVFGFGFGFGRRRQRRCG